MHLLGDLLSEHPHSYDSLESLQLEIGLLLLMVEVLTWSFVFPIWDPDITDKK
jgi:hypothetical protein